MQHRRIRTLVVQYCAKIVWFFVSSERLETEYKIKASFSHKHLDLSLYSDLLYVLGETYLEKTIKFLKKIKKIKIKRRSFLTLCAL